MSRLLFSREALEIIHGGGAIPEPFPIRLAGEWAPDKRRSRLVGKNKRSSSVLCASAVEVKQEGSRKMRSNRRRNWFIKRFALGLAIAAVAAPVAQAKMDESSFVQANGYQSFATDFPSSRRSTRPQQIELVRVEQPRLTPSAAALAGESDRARPSRQPRSTPERRRVRPAAIRSRSCSALPHGSPSDKIEFVRTQPRSIGEPQVVSAGFDWKDAGIGAGLALALVLLGVGAALASRHVGRAQTA